MVEGAQAYVARRDGVLAQFDPLGSNTIWEAAEEATRAFARKQAQDLDRAARERQKR